MLTMKRRRIAVGLVLLAWCAAASAVSLSLRPTPASYAQGSTFSLDVVVDGLDAVNDFVTAYDLDVGFQPGIDFDSATSSGALGNSVFSATAGVGTVNIFESSFELDSFFASQPDPVTLATLTFVGASVGVFDFVLTATDLGGSQIPDPQNPNGPTITRDLLVAFEPTLNGASITITPRAAVPEPATPLLLALAALLSAFSFRSRRT